jgi:hypothetical protein
MVVHLYFAIDQKGLPEGPKALFFISKWLNERLQSVGNLVRIRRPPEGSILRPGERHPRQTP